MKVLKAYVDWREGSGSLPLLNILADRRPFHDLRYEKKGDIYFAEKDGYVSFHVWSGNGNDRGMGGSEVPTTMKDGRQVILKGPWSSNPESVEKAGFEPTMAVAFFDNACEAGMMCGTVENRFLEWRVTVAVYQNSRKRWLLDTSVQLFWRFLRDNSLGWPENCCNLDEMLVLWGFKCV